MLWRISTTFNCASVNVYGIDSIQRSSSERKWQFGAACSLQCSATRLESSIRLKVRNISLKSVTLRHRKIQHLRIDSVVSGEVNEFVPCCWMFMCSVCSHHVSWLFDWYEIRVWFLDQTTKYQYHTEVSTDWARGTNHHVRWIYDQTEHGSRTWTYHCGWNWRTKCHHWNWSTSDILCKRFAPHLWPSVVHGEVE